MAKALKTTQTFNEQRMPIDSICLRFHVRQRNSVAFFFSSLFIATRFRCERERTTDDDDDDNNSEANDLVSHTFSDYLRRDAQKEKLRDKVQMDSDENLVTVRLIIGQEKSFSSIDEGWPWRTWLYIGLAILCIIGIVAALLFCLLGKISGKNKRSQTSGTSTTTKAVVTKGISTDQRYQQVPNV